MSRKYEKHSGKRKEKHYKKESWSDNCYVYIMMYDSKRNIRCDFSCCDTGKPCRNYINAYWKIMRFRHYKKTKPKFPTTLEAWKNRVKPF